MTIQENFKDINSTFSQIFSHRSIRVFDSNYEIPKEHLNLMIKAGQQASTSCTGQMYSIIEISKEKRDQIVPLCGDQQFVKDASFFGIICIDLNRLQKIVELSGGINQEWPIAGLLIGIFDAGLFSQNMVLAAESLGYGICFCGSCGDRPDEITKLLNLPELVMPLTGIAIGKSLESPPTRPRLPTNLIWQVDNYKSFTKDELINGIAQMNEKLVKEGYYKKYSNRDNYTWKDHMKNKFGGKWLNIIEKRRIKTLKSQKFITFQN